MIFSFSFLLYVAGAYAQITLEECQRKTQDNYPLVHQYGLVEKTKEYNLENAAKGYLPQFSPREMTQTRLNVSFLWFLFSDGKVD